MYCTVLTNYKQPQYKLILSHTDTLSLSQEHQHTDCHDNRHTHTLVAILWSKEEFTQFLISGIVCVWCVCTDSCFCATEQTWSRVLIGPSCKRARSCPPQMMMWSPWKCFAIVQSSRKVPSIKTCGGLGNCPQMFSIPEFASNIYIQMMRNGGKLTNQSKGTVFSCFACFFF